MYRLLYLSCHAKWVHGEYEDAVSKHPVRMRSDNVVLYNIGDGTLDTGHRLSPAVYVQEWHSFSSGFITFLPIHGSDNEILSI
jgi:hypothetical protein